MAALIPKFQRFEDQKVGYIVGITEVVIVSSSDTITVPQLANSTTNRSAAQLRRENDSAVTVTDDADDQVTLASGTVGDAVIILTLHTHLNFGAEA